MQLRTMRQPLSTKSRRRTRVLIVDDHPLFRHGLRRVLEGEDDMAVSAEAGDASSALDAIRADPPDVAIVDLALKGRSGLELVRDMKSARPALPVLMLSMFDESLYAERAIRAGAAGYLMKQEAPQEVIEALRRILKGHLHVSPAVSSQMVRKVVGNKASQGGLATIDAVAAQSAPAPVKTRIQQLSDRELEIFELIGQGFSTGRIADTLFRSVKTIESHRENIKVKLGVSSSGELLRCAVEHSLQLGDRTVQQRHSVATPSASPAARGGGDSYPVEVHTPIVAGRLADTNAARPLSSPSSQ